MRARNLPARIVNFLDSWSCLHANFPSTLLRFNHDTPHLTADLDAGHIYSVWQRKFYKLFWRFLRSLSTHIIRDLLTDSSLSVFVFPGRTLYSTITSEPVPLSLPILTELLLHLMFHRLLLVRRRRMPSRLRLRTTCGRSVGL